MHTDEPALPVDSDIEAAETPVRAPRPVHLRWEYVLLVVLGGSVGTAARYLLSALIPPWQDVPVATFGINVAGAFALGALLETLARGGPDQGTRRFLRLLVGTGMLGGFTTYSSLSVETDTLFAAGRFGHAALYAGGTLVTGAVASLAGILVAAAIHKRGRQR